MKVTKRDVHELIERYSHELISEEFIDLHCVSQQQDVEDNLSVNKNKADAKQQSSGEIEEKLNVRETVVSYIRKNHHKMEVTLYASNLFDDCALSHCYQLTKNRQKQLSLGRFLVVSLLLIISIFLFIESNYHFRPVHSSIEESGIEYNGPLHFLRIFL
ncbi:hypothetical protein WA026_006250 [Henosepilachna vigintioctopunctata]|uniref:Uncharacterized protein n=1 Tax=Henosepilachna vigintioctopunctata TaxID=420089 RepID=A0AAW1TJU0_9CUCU